MKLVGLMCAKNEAWCLPLTLPAALAWVDELVFLDHCSADFTYDIVRATQTQSNGKIHILRETDPEWNEAAYRQRLLDKGRQVGGTHFAIIDADEILTANNAPNIKEQIAQLRSGNAMIVRMPCLWKSTDQYRDDPSPFGTMFCKFSFADSAKINYKAPDGYELHARLPSNLWPGQQTTYPHPGYDRSPLGINKLQVEGGVLHLQHVVWERLLWKQLWYQMKEMVRWGKIRANYAAAVDETGLVLKPVPSDWIQGYDFGLLDLTVPPWQKAGCRYLWHNFDHKVFEGVNFFGLKEQL